MRNHISILLRLLSLSMLLLGANLIAQENPDPKENPDANDDTAQPVTEADLAAQARDPTAPVTAFVTRYDYISDFHNLKGADQQQLVLQPIIPWKWGLCAALWPQNWG